MNAEDPNRSGSGPLIEGMGWISVVVGVLMIVGALGLDPRTVWRSTQGWQYRNPEANEPSDEAYALKRFGFVLSGIIAIGAGLYFNARFTGSILGIS